MAQYQPDEGHFCSSDRKINIDDRGLSLGAGDCKKPFGSCVSQFVSPCLRFVEVHLPKLLPRVVVTNTRFSLKKPCSPSNFLPHFPLL